MKKTIVALFASLFVLASPAAAQSWDALSGDSSISQARTAVVRSQAEWTSLWAEHDGGGCLPLPAVDFSREMVLAVFLGEKPSAGWKAEIKPIVDPLDGSRLVVFYRALPPEPKQFSPQVVTRPFLMVKVPVMATVAFQADTMVKALDGSLIVDKAPRTGQSPSVAASKGRLARFFDGEWYASWGYNKETWAPVDIHVSQPSLGNDFTVHDVKAHDEPGWDHDLLKKGISIPQYQFVIGRFVDKKRTLAVEFNWDHTKYSSTKDQTARVTGMVGGKQVDEQRTLSPEYFRYHLHNGANHVMVNVVKRLPLIRQPNQSLSVAGIAKAGVGVMLPHADNTIMGNELDLGEKVPSNWFGKHNGWWQLDGWTAGLEAGVRIVPVRPFYVEFTDKIAYSRMSDVAVYQGTAKHDLWMNQLSLSVGVMINGGKKVARP